MTKKREGPTGISARTLKALEDSGVSQWMREQSRGSRSVETEAPEYVAQPGMAKRRRGPSITAPDKRRKRKHYGMRFNPK